MFPSDTIEDTTITCRGETFELYITADRIQRRLRAIGRMIDQQYTDRRPILIGVLNGAFMVLGDLMRTISIECEVDFVKLSSYGAEKVSSGEVTELKRVDADLSGRDVLVIEDIIDTGQTLSYLLELLQAQKPKSITIATLLLKPEVFNNRFKIDYIGLEIPNRFVIGYGMDYEGHGRQLPDIYAAKANL